MARLFLAESLASGLRKLVVLKVLNPQFCVDEDVRAAFRREAELSAQMNHPNVVQVLEVADYGDAPVIVMEYLEGVSLSSLMKQAGSELPLPLHMHLLSQVLAGLHHFHELRDLDGAPLNAVHRDVSPQIVMVLHDGLVKVLDFGIAKVTSPNSEVTRSGVIKGKLHYMPPEQLLGEPDIDRRADIFAVGVMLWEAIARRRMWQDGTETDLLRCLAKGDVPRLEDVVADVPDPLLEIVRRATATDRSRRFATAREMQGAIERALAQLGWVVQPHDLAEFMARHFGESRYAQQLRIKDALRAAPSIDGSNELRRQNQSLHAVVRTLHSSVLRALRTSPRRYRWFFVAACCAVLAVTWSLRAGAPSREQRASAPQQKFVTLQVETLPRGAEIHLDGEHVGTGRFTTSYPVDGRNVRVEVLAPGYRPERRELVLRTDVSLSIALERQPTVQAARPADIPAPASASSTATASSRRSAAPVRAVAPARIPPSLEPRPDAVSGKRSGDCNPPYTFTADGVKAYKVECF
jgi:serine/threonine-protein kinase